MRVRRFAIAGLLLLVACGSDEQFFAEPLESTVVYGNDDRLEVYAHPDAGLRQVASESIVAQIALSNLSELGDGSYQLNVGPLWFERDVCPDEPFADQPVAARCSGVLIADDLVLTAGHCVNCASTACSAYSYVFNYHLTAEGQNYPGPFPESDVYRCAEVPVCVESGSVTPDYAIVRLDRPVTPDHAPAELRPVTPLEVGDSLAMIGSGTGLPVKIDSGASVAEVEADYYVANLDAFQGHSGSAVFDENDQLAGILVSGRVPDYNRREGEFCLEVNVFDDSLAGENVQFISRVVDAICEAGEGNESLCGEDACDGGPCGEPPTIDPKEPETEAPGVVGVSTDGCSVGRGSPVGAPFGMLLFAWIVVRRLRRTVA